MLADGYVTLECPLCPAVSHFLGELGVVPVEEFQQGFLLDPYTEIGIFQLGCCNISARLHQFMIAAVYFHSDFIHRTVDSLRFDTLAGSSVVLHVPQPQWNVHLATELFDFTVHRDTAHQRQVAVRLFAAFLHIEQYFECTSHNSLLFLVTKLYYSELPTAMQNYANRRIRTA